jgi:predicted TPR repeat methyltransferase
VNTLFSEACTAQAEERFFEAREKYLLLLEYFPEATVLHYNLGLVYYTLQEYEEALREFSLALASQPEDGDILFNLALCRKKTGGTQEAITTYLKLLEITPDSTDCWYNLAGCYRDLHDDRQAVSCYRRVVDLDPEYLPALSNLAYLHHRAGETETAEACYRRLLAARPDDQSAQYMLASLLGAPLDRAPDDYVRNFFDSYAEGFEESLVAGLGYDNPRQLYGCFAQCPGRKPTYDRGLDLGCGTGLSGLAFQDCVGALDGVDLSGNMLQQAARKECYTVLYQDSISNFLRTTTETYDLFLATDVFIYVGELREIFTDLRTIARPEAFFCFSTEHLAAEGYQLQQTGRFAYSSDYIRSVAAATGWRVVAEEPTRLRKEREQWLEGELWVLALAPQ